MSKDKKPFRGHRYTIGEALDPEVVKALKRLVRTSKEAEQR